MRACVGACVYLIVCVCWRVCSVHDVCLVCALCCSLCCVSRCVCVCVVCVVSVCARFVVCSFSTNTNISSHELFIFTGLFCIVVMTCLFLRGFCDSHDKKFEGPFGQKFSPEACSCWLRMLAFVGLVLSKPLLCSDSTCRFTSYLSLGKTFKLRLTSAWPLFTASSHHSR